MDLDCAAERPVVASSRVRLLRHMELGGIFRVCGKYVEKIMRTDSALEYGTEQVGCCVTRDLNNRSLCVILVRRTCPFEADLSPDR